MTNDGRELSEKEVEQRREAGQNSKVHGVYAIRDRGDEAMTPAQRSRRAELVEQLDTRQGVVEAMRDQAVDTLILANVAQSFCVEQHQEGRPLDKIPLLGALPRFWNAANRALKTYLDAMPDDSEVLDLAEHVKRAMNNGSGDRDNS